MDLHRHGPFLLGPAYSDALNRCRAGRGVGIFSHLSPSSFALSLCPEFLVHPKMSMRICMDGHRHTCVACGQWRSGGQGLHVLHCGQAP